MLRALVLCLAPLPVLAEDFRPVHDRADFVALIAVKELKLPLFAIVLRVDPDGGISGEAMGKPVSGRWRWESGYFCREMVWGSYPIAHDCQLVEARGQDALRFTVDRGAGDSAQFRLH